MLGFAILPRRGTAKGMGETVILARGSKLRTSNGLKLRVWKGKKYTKGGVVLFRHFSPREARK